TPTLGYPGGKAALEMESETFLTHPITRVTVLTRIARAIKSSDEPCHTSTQKIEIGFPRLGSRTLTIRFRTREITFSDKIHIRAIVARAAHTINPSLTDRREIREHAGFHIVLIQILTTAFHRVTRQPRGGFIGEKHL